MLKRFQRKYLPFVIAFLGKWGMRLIVKTCKVRVDGLSKLHEAAGTSPCILALWHNNLAAVPEVLHRFSPQFTYTAFISKSRDAEALALLTHSYPNGKALRVPHNARHFALTQMIHLLKERDSIVIITPDGPRGPKCTVKPGIVAAARGANAKIIPFTWAASRTWKLSTWDQMRIPKPFSTLVVTFGDPISLEEGKTLEEQCDLICRALG